MPDDLTANDLLGITAESVVAHVSNNPVSMNDLPALITEVYGMLSLLGSPSTAIVT